VEKKKEFEKLVDTQIKKLEPAFDKFYKELKVAAGKYGVNLDKLEKSVKTTTEKAASRLNIQPKSTKAKPKTQTSASASASEKSAGGGSAKKSGTGSRKKKASKKA
jgi:activator of HSP90 ATPase